jgi:hypothetical protein
MKPGGKLTIKESSQGKETQRLLENYFRKKPKRIGEIEKLLTKENLGTKNDDGQTLLHIGATTGALPFVPKELITTSNMSVLDDQGQTVLHLACASAMAHAIPEHMITDKAMRIQDGEGYTPYHWCMFTGQPKSIPKSLWNEETLKIENIFSNTPLDMLVAHAEQTKNMTILGEFATLASKRQLKTIITRKKYPTTRSRNIILAELMRRELDKEGNLNLMEL